LRMADVCSRLPAAIRMLFDDTLESERRMRMVIIPSGVTIHLALGRTDMRKGFDSLAVLVKRQNE
jgi:hypothetical protein